jgi:hypothetical protein
MAEYPVQKAKPESARSGTSSPLCPYGAVGVLDGVVDLHAPLGNTRADRLNTGEVARVRL